MPSGTLTRGANVGAIPGDHLVQLDAADNRLLQRHFAEVTTSAYADQEAFLLQASLAAHQFPHHMREKLLKFRRQSNIDGVLFIRGLPPDPKLPNTPTEPHDISRYIPKRTFASEFWLAAVASLIGEPIGYGQEKAGSVFQNIFPVRENEEQLSSESSKIFLDFHTETAFHPFLPDYVMLYGVRQDHDKVARTPFSSIRRVFPNLTPSQRETLFRNDYVTGVDYSFGSGKPGTEDRPRISVLRGDPFDPLMIFDLDLMVGLTDSAQRALEALRDLVREYSNYVVIGPGTLLIVDNLRAVHARSEFIPRYDGKDRWLQRMYVVRDLHASAKDRSPGDRVIRSEF